MIDREKFYITITEAPDFQVNLSAKETEELKKKVLAKINEKGKTQGNRSKVVVLRRKVISFFAAALLLIFSSTAIASITNQRQKTIKPVETEPSTQATTEQKKTEPAKDDSTPQINDFSRDEDKVQNSEKFTPAVTTPITTEPVIAYTAPAKTYVTLNCDFIQGYSMVDKKDGWYAFECTDGYNTDMNFDVQIIWRNTAWSRDIIQELGTERSTDYDPEYEQFMLGEHKAMYVKYPYGSLYSQQLFVSYPEYNYVLTIMGERGIDKGTFINLGKQISLTNATETDGAYHVNLFDYFENYSPDALKKSLTGKAVDNTTVKQMNEPVSLDSCEITVENITAYDNISEFVISDEESESTAGMKKAVINNLSLFTDADGNLPEYSRNIVVTGDGYMTPKEKITASYNVKQKFYTLQIKVKNIGDTTVENFNTEFPFAYLTETEKGFGKDITGYKRPFIVELCQENSLPKYFSHDENLTLTPNQEEIITLGYFADEDLSGKMFLSIENNLASSNNYVDLR